MNVRSSNGFDVARGYEDANLYASGGGKSRGPVAFPHHADAVSPRPEPAGGFERGAIIMRAAPETQPSRCAVPEPARLGDRTPTPCRAHARHHVRAWRPFGRSRR